MKKKKKSLRDKDERRGTATAIIQNLRLCLINRWWLIQRVSGFDKFKQRDALMHLCSGSASLSQAARG